MKRILSLLASFSVFAISFAFTVHVSVPGTLESTLDSLGVDKSLSELTVTGNIDVNDMYYMRGDDLPNLATVDISGTSLTIFPNGLVSWSNKIRNITLPDSLIEIGIGAFMRSSVQNLIVPNSVTHIAYEAFLESSIRNIELPNSLISIGYSAFEDAKLQSITLPKSLTQVGGGAFRYCTGLQSIEIPSSLTNFGSDVFTSCINLQSVKLSDSLKSLPTGMFSSCSSLKSIEIPSSVTSIGNSVFSYCSGLQSVELPDSLLTLGGSAFKGCSSLQSVEIPSSVIHIENSAFNGCSSLQSVELPDSLLTLGAASFRGCSSLQGIEIPASITQIEAQVLMECSNIQSVTVSDSLTQIGASVFEGCSKLQSFKIPQSVTHIGASAFKGCVALQNLIMPNSLTYIGAYSFMGCSRLQSFMFPDSLKTLNAGLFQDCRVLRELTLPNMITSIEANTFSNCSEIVHVTLPDSLISIGESAFSGISNLVVYSNIFPPSIKSSTFAYTSSYPDNVIFLVPSELKPAYDTAYIWEGFGVLSKRDVTIDNPTAGNLAVALITEGYDPLRSITHLTVSGELNSDDFLQMKDNMKGLLSVNMENARIKNDKLPSRAFLRKTTLCEVKLPSTLKEIGDEAFGECSKLRMIEFPTSIEYIGRYAFSETSFSGVINLPSNLKTIGIGAFYRCSRLEGRLVLPEGLISVGGGAFRGCSRLNGVLEFPSNITAIGGRAFKECSGFDQLVLNNKLETIGTEAFSGCSGFKGELILPNSLKSISSQAFDNCRGFSGSLRIPDLITEMPLGYDKDHYRGVFQNLSGIDSLYLSKNITRIYHFVFQGMTGLKYISVPRIDPPTINTRTFEFVDKENCIVNVPIGAAINYQIATYWSSFFNIIESDISFNYDLSISIGSHGQVKVDDQILYQDAVLGIENNSVKVFSVEPDFGYKIQSVTYNGIDVMSELVDNQYSAPRMDSDAELIVTFTASLDSDINVYSNHHNIIVTGVTAGKQINIYTLDGKQVKVLHCTEDPMTIPMEDRYSVYIVRVGSRTFKITL